MNEILISNELLDEYRRNFQNHSDVRKLEPELEEERIKGLRDGAAYFINVIGKNLKDCLNRESEDCTETIRNNLINIKEEMSDVRQHTLSTLFKKYIKDKSPEDSGDNLFIEYMKRQVCADLPQLGKLIDLVYNRMPEIKLADRLDVINEAIYSAFLEYLSTPNLVVPNNRANRIGAERMYAYNASHIDVKGPDLCMKNSLKSGNMVVSCITSPEIFRTNSYIRFWPGTNYKTMDFVKYALTGVRPSEYHLGDDVDITALNNIKVCNNGTLTVYFSSATDMRRIFEDNIRDLRSYGEHNMINASVYVATTVAPLYDGNFKVSVGLKHFDLAELGWTEPGFTVSVTDLLNTSSYSADEHIMLESAGDALDSLIHSLIRKDHALEDIIGIFVQLLATEIPDEDMAEPGATLLLGKCRSCSERDTLVKIAMAAVLAPVKKTAAGFIVAPDIDTIVAISGIDKNRVCYYIAEFAMSFGLEFFSSKVSGTYPLISHYFDRLKPNDSRYLVFNNGPVSGLGVFARGHNKHYLDVIRPRIKKLLALHIVATGRGITEDTISTGALMNACVLTSTEFLALDDDFLLENMFRPALSFYFSIVSSLVYTIGFKVASLLPYRMEAALQKEHRSQLIRVKSIVYGMGSGLIHTVFESIGNVSDADVAIPISQYIVPDIGSAPDGLFSKLHDYANDIMFNIRLLTYYLAKCGNVIVRETSKYAAADIVRSLPDFKSVKILYINDPDCVNTFAPGFKGVFKPGDRGTLEESLARIRSKIEGIYYVISARRPLVSEEYLEDANTSISMLTDADRMGTNEEVMNRLINDVRNYSGMSGAKVLANPDVSTVSLDARPLSLTCNNILEGSDINEMAGMPAKYIGMGMESSTETAAQALFLDFPPNINRRLLPAVRNMAIKNRRRGYPMIGLFIESGRWSVTSKTASYYASCPYLQMYKITDRRDSVKRLPVISLPEFSGGGMVDVESNGMINIASDKKYTDEADIIDMSKKLNTIENKILRFASDSCVLPLYTNYRFMAAERRRWDEEKYPKYIAAFHIKRICLDCGSGTLFKKGDPYNLSPWQLNNHAEMSDFTRSSEFSISTYEPLTSTVGMIENDIERKRYDLICKARNNENSEKEENSKGWSQLWLETVLKQINNQTNTSSSVQLDPFSFSDDYAREIAMSFRDDYRSSDQLVIHTLADTEDVSKSVNIYMEPVDFTDTSLARRKARMRMIALIILGMHKPCTKDFLTEVSRESSIEESPKVKQIKKEDLIYRPTCKIRELTEVSSEVRVNSTKSDIDKEMQELRRQKEEYCKKFRESMNNLKKQRRSLLDNRCFLNNKDAFTEEEKGIESLYKKGQILGYRLICRDKNDTSGGSDGTTVLLDTENFVANRDVFLRKIARRTLSVDLIALTTPIYIWSGAFIFSIGKVTINIRDIFDPKNIKPQFYNEDETLLAKYIKAGLSNDDIPKNSSYIVNMDAPHVRLHRACLGNLEGNLNAAAGAEDILAYLEWCLLYLSTVKLGDPYGSCLSYFPCIPATLHNVIKYGVLDSGRLDDHICLWTGGGGNSTVNAYSTRIVQPVWNISDDLINALWLDAKQKLETNAFEGSDILIDDLLPIVGEVSIVNEDSPLNWRKADAIYRNILSYSMCKIDQEAEPGDSLSSTSSYVADPSRFSSALRAGISQKLEHREYFMQKSLRFMQYAQESGRAFSSLWNVRNLDDSKKISLAQVKVDRLKNYHINI